MLTDFLLVKVLDFCDVLSNSYLFYSRLSWYTWPMLCSRSEILPSRFL